MRARAFAATLLLAAGGVSLTGCGLFSAAPLGQPQVPLVTLDALCAGAPDPAAGAGRPAIFSSEAEGACR